MDFDFVIYSELITFFILFGLLLLYPKDCLLIIAAMPLWLNAIRLNYFLMFKAWQAHRQIVKDCVKIGLPPPAFKFTPIWDR